MDWRWREVKRKIEQKHLFGTVRITAPGVVGSRGKPVRESIWDVLRLRSLKEHDQTGSLSQKRKVWYSHTNRSESRDSKRHVRNGALGRLR